MGQFKEYLGLESIASSNDISFVERALPSRTFNDIAGGSDGRRLGVGVNTFGHNVWAASAGIFGRSAAGEPGTDYQSDPTTFVGRLTLSPWHTENRAFHLGFAGSWLIGADRLWIRALSMPRT